MEDPIVCPDCKNYLYPGMKPTDQELLRAADSLTIFNCLQRSLLRIEDMIDKKIEQEPK